MTILRTAHHGVHGSTIDGVAAALRPAGFTYAAVGGRTEFRPDNSHPLRDVCRKCGPSYGDEFDMLVLENPTSRQQLALIEIKGPWLVNAPGSQPAQTDLTIVLPVDGDPERIYREMRLASPDLSFSQPVAEAEGEGISVAIDGQRYILTRSSEPYAIVHYTTDDFPSAREFYERILGASLEELPPRDATARYRVVMDAHLEIEVREDTPILSPATGKRYCGGSYFRMTDIDLSKVNSLGLPAPAVLDVATGRSEWFFTPEGGAGYVYGPLGEMIELFDVAADYSDSLPYCPEVEAL